MSIEIKSRYGGVLYTAKNACDVRTALTEAVRQGADLRGAYLQGAYLQGADLRGAYLQGAYLRGADLQGAYLRGADLQGAYLRGADLRGAYLQGAYLQGADLQGAYLQGADLRGAYLRGAYLQGAYLQGADLQGADLQGAYLQGALGVNALLTTPLHILTDQVGKIRAYKLVTADGQGPQYGGITYRRGETVEVKNAVTNPNVECGAGINVATLDWCITNWIKGYRILVVEFTAKDIAAIPTGSDGKFRLHRCKVVGEKKLEEVGLS